jgi:hypothetical protein
MRDRGRGDPFPGAEETAHHGAGPRAQEPGRLAVGEPDDVDGDDGVAHRLVELRDGGVGELGVNRRAVRLGPPVDDPLEVLRGGGRRAAAGARLREGGPPVTEDPQQVDQVVLVAQEARAAEHLLVRVLHEILGVLTGSGQRVRRPKEAHAMALEPCGIESSQPARRRAGHRAVQRGLQFGRRRRLVSSAVVGHLDV